MTETITSERSFAIVGEFMFAWALVENAINQLVGTVLNVDPVESVILSKTLRVNQKLEMLELLTTHNLIEERVKARCKSLIPALKRLSRVRNTAAHSVFAPREDRSAVRFYDVKQGSGELKFSTMEWTERDFQEHLQKLLDLKNELEALKDKLKELGFVQRWERGTPLWSKHRDLAYYLIPPSSDISTVSSVVRAGAVSRNRKDRSRIILRPCNTPTRRAYGKFRVARRIGYGTGFDHG